MAYSPIEIIKVARPIHWVKNFALFAALIFSGHLFTDHLFLKVVWAFIIFSLLTSSAYIINDIKDAKYDRLHPIKKNRPIAAERLPVPTAIAAALVLGLFALYLAAHLNPLFFLMVILYLLLQIGYSFGLKNIPIIDILIIAAGFVIRVYVGAFVINAHLSVWFLLCIISAALFLASGKRKAEVNTIEKTAQVTRKSISKYPDDLLNSYVTMFANAAWMSWALFTFFESPQASLPVWLFLSEISLTTTVNKLLMITIPVVIFGIMRYQSLIFDNKTEAPERIVLTDIPLTLSVTVWLALVLFIFYGGASSPAFLIN